MLFRIIAVCLALAACYAAFEIAVAWRNHDRLYNPHTSFSILNEGNQTTITIVEFMNYDCLNCRGTHKSLIDYAKANPDVRIVVRPFPNAGGFFYSEEAAKMVIAAGLQGKFWEMDKAIVDYQNRPNERFYRETAGLLDLDYEKMQKDAEGEEVQNILGDNAEAVQRAGVTSVPALMIGDKLHQFDKALTLNDLISMVAAERAK